MALIDILKSLGAVSIEEDTITASRDWPLDTHSSNMWPATADSRDEQTDLSGKSPENSGKQSLKAETQIKPI